MNLSPTLSPTHYHLLLMPRMSATHHRQRQRQRLLAGNCYLLQERHAIITRMVTSHLPINHHSPIAWQSATPEDVKRLHISRRKPLIEQSAGIAQPSLVTARSIHIHVVELDCAGSSSKHQEALG
jgi:hypothetical protein